MPRKTPPFSETTLIADLRRRFQTPRGRPGSIALGIGDDCALLNPAPGHQLAVTTDLFLEGRHFRRDTHTARSSGHRCIARGLSDLAAMGATPLAAFLSLALPPDTATTLSGRRWLASFLDGLHALALQTKTPIAGGDTSESPGPFLLADIVLLGQVKAGKALTRAAAKPGDHLYVSGSLGGSAAELASMFARAAVGRPPSPRPGPQSFPEPRLALGRALSRRPGVTACLDLSDGLSTDLAHLVAESGVTATLEAARIPLHPGATLAQALHGGEDYELLFTASPSTRLPRTLAGVPLTRIGAISAGSPQVLLQQPDGSTTNLQPGGWEHLTAPRA